MAHTPEDFAMSTQLTMLGRDLHDQHGTVNPPVHRTSTILIKDFEELEAYDYGKPCATKGYGRFGTPSTHALETALTTLEGADHGWVLSSGCAAIAAGLMAFLSQGDHLLISDNIYGPTRKLADGELKRFGIEVSYYDPTLPIDEIEKLLQPNTRVIYFETPGSLTFEMIDVPALCTMGHAHDCIMMGDNTWGTPLYFKPYDMGVDVSIHSATKYISGHSDLIMGYISCTSEHFETLNRTVRNTGANPSGDNCYLSLRGLRTMEVRMKQQQQSAIDVATWLQSHDAVTSVHYPALQGDAGHEIWKRDFHASGASLFGIVLKDCTREQVRACVDAFKLFGIGYSWGGYESLVIAYKPHDLRYAMRGKWDENTYMLRLHIGLENVDDIKADLTQALSHIL